MELWISLCACDASLVDLSFSHSIDHEQMLLSLGI
jgi:hypothetical protein